MLLFPLSAISQDYLWPTNASGYLSSSFCEFREGHYHSAIDIKTWNTEGYPCYAVEDGYIKRIRISPFGYGKVLYLQLKDGNTAVYAHLQKFTDEVENQIQKQQFNNKQYRLNWWPKNLKVKKGDIIAYTGRTGIGVPHLHFEIRNKQDHPINPLHYYNQIKDHKRPKLQNLAVIPLSKTSTVNNNFRPQQYNLTHIKDGIHVVKDPIYVTGKIGFAVNGYDQADDVSNKYGFYQSTLEVSGKPIFQITYDELDFSTTEHIFSEIFYPFWSDHKQVYNKLYLESFNPLLFYNRKLDSDGSVRVTDKPVSFTITISDFMKNRSVIKGELLPIEKNLLEIVSSSIQDSLVYLKFNAPQIKELKFYTKRTNHSWVPVNFYEIIEGKLNNPQESKLVRLNLDESSVISLKVRVNNRYERILSFTDINENTNHFEKFYSLGDQLIGEFQGNFKNPRINVSGNLSPVPFHFPEEENFQVLLTAKMIGDKKVTLLMEDIKDKTWSMSLDYHALIPGEKKLFNWFDSSLVLSTHINSVTDTVLITALRHEEDSTGIDIPTVSDIFEIKPDNFPIFKPLSISIQADSLPGWGRWSIFKINGSDRFQYLQSQIDSNRMLLSTKTSSFGKFIVAADTIPPEVHIKSPRSGKIYKSNPQINLIIKDSLSGIKDENQISLSMDGEYVLPEWDPEEDLIVGILENDLSVGNHIFSASIRDRSGNITRQAVYFKIQ
jgi:hypothetical protein